MSAGTERSSAPSSCHCQVVDGAGTQRSAGTMRTASISTVRRQFPPRRGLRSRRVTVCVPAPTAGRSRRAPQPRERTRSVPPRPSAVTVSFGAPAQRRARATTTSRPAPANRSRAVPRCVRASARPPLAVASRTTAPAPAARSASTRAVGVAAVVESKIRASAALAITWTMRAMTAAGT